MVMNILMKKYCLICPILVTSMFVSYDLGDIVNFISRGTTYWTDVFVRYFLFQTDRSIDADDLLFFIRKRHVRGVTLPKFQVSGSVSMLYSTLTICPAQ